MTATFADINPYLALLLVGFLPNEIWRWLGVLFARRIDEGSEILTWVRAVATAVLAGVVAQLIFDPPGALAQTHLAVRLAGIAAGFVAFMAIRKSVFAGIVVGQIVLVLGTLLFP
jgi:branched-subunit amino acid transport protein